ncbi:MAG: hypothetical protein R3Y58_02475 [Eubacteriales bacterium]
MQTAKGFIHDEVVELLKDEELVKQLTACKTEEEACAIVSAKVNIPQEELVASIETAKIIGGMNQENGLLDQDELDMIAGGKSSKMYYNTQSKDVML